MKIKYNLSQFMAAADYLAKYNEYTYKPPLEWLASMDTTIRDAVKQGSLSSSTGGYHIDLYRADLDTDDLIAEISVDPLLWAEDPDYHFTEMTVNYNDNRQRTTEATSLEAA